MSQLGNRSYKVTLMGKSYNVALYDKGVYRDGSLAIEARETGDLTPFGVLTVYVEGTELNRNEILVKTWSENEEWTKGILDCGLFEDTGRRVKTGYVEAQVWKFKE